MVAHEIRTLFTSADGEQVVDSATTQKQIQEAEALECALEHDGQCITWKDLDDPAQLRTIFQSILRDRKIGDEHILIAGRQAFAVITAMEGKAVRLEFYEGHGSLKLIFDLRSGELQGKPLPNFLESDPYTYDPAKFLKELLRT